jgi:hypothetical protein
MQDMGGERYFFRPDGLDGCACVLSAATKGENARERDTITTHVDILHLRFYFPLFFLLIFFPFFSPNWTGSERGVVVKGLTK